MSITESSLFIFQAGIFSKPLPDVTLKENKILNLKQNSEKVQGGASCFQRRKFSHVFENKYFETSAYTYILPELLGSYV